MAERRGLRRPLGPVASFVAPNDGIELVGDERKLRRRAAKLKGPRKYNRLAVGSSLLVGSSRSLSPLAKREKVPRCHAQMR